MLHWNLFCLEWEKQFSDKIFRFLKPENYISEVRYFGPHNPDPPNNKHQKYSGNRIIITVEQHEVPWVEDTMIVEETVTNRSSTDVLSSSGPGCVTIDELDFSKQNKKFTNY